ncbi:MAG: hypothetical protein DME30_12015 [Verrucomicrobia bacterium]|nr:MAG: hypothetical protein DME30_12015 [Verrucomicrobiota bacterium]
MSIAVQVAVQGEHSAGGQDDGVPIAGAHHAFGGDEMVGIGCVNRDAMRATVQAVVEDGRVYGLLQRTAAGADAADLLRSCSHIDPGA